MNGAFSGIQMIDCVDGKFLRFIIIPIESKLASLVSQFLKPFELPEFDKDIQKMIIEKDYGNNYYGNLIIKDYPNLQSIVVKKKSLRKLCSLKICNCDKLKMIEVEDSDRFFSGTFFDLKEVALMSSFY